MPLFDTPSITTASVPLMAWSCVSDSAEILPPRRYAPTSAVLYCEKSIAPGFVFELSKPLKYTRATDASADEPPKNAATAAALANEYT